MDPIKAGAVDYSMAMQQPQQAQAIPADYTSMPMMYEPEAQPKSGGGAGLLGMTLLGLATAGAGAFIGYKKGAKGLKNANTALAEAEAKYSQIVKDKEVLEKAKNEAETSLKDYRDAGWRRRFVRLFNPNYKLSEAEKNAKKAAKDAAKETKNAGKDKADDVAKKTDEAKKD